MEDQNRCELEMDLSQMNENGRPSSSWLCCVPCYWLKRNSGFHKMSLSIVTFLVTVLLVASPVLFLISSIPGEKFKNCEQQEGECKMGESEVCVTEECSKAGNRIISSISWKANPCENFYQFACGYLKENPKFFNQNKESNIINFVTLQQQVDRNIQSLLTVASNSEPFEKLGTFYQSCIRAEHKPASLIPMLFLLEELGGYVEPKENPPRDLTDLVLSLLRLNGAPLFDIYLDSDWDNSSEMAPFIDLPSGFGINLGLEPKLMRWWHHNQACFRLENYLSKTFPTFGGNKKANHFIKSSLEEKRLLIMEKIMRDFMPHNFSFHRKINEIETTLHFANTITKLYPKKREIIKSNERGLNAKIAIKDLERKLPFIRWQYLLEKFFKEKVSPQDNVVVLALDYLENLQRTLHRFPFRVIHNGLLVVFATDTLYELVNASASADWTTFCNKITINTFGKAVSVSYVRQFREPYVKELRMRVTHIFKTLKKSFEKRIKNISWLDERTRGAVLQKLEALRIQFLSSHKHWNATYASSLMADVQVHPEDFFGNVIHRYRVLRNSSDKFKWDLSKEKRWTYPFIVNAFYVLSLNTIIVPLALLTHPYLRGELPLYVPYSTLGLIIAHEILHGFDLKGIGLDSKGKFGIFMSQGSREKFEARLDCFVKQFSSSFWRKAHLLRTNVNVQFDWNTTKNENMADISGLQMAYQAWKSVVKPENEPHLPGVSLNPRQLFFLNAAQTYCTMLSPADNIFLVEVDFHIPQPERVNGIMMNSPEFGQAYSCSLGSPMNPRKKCSIW